MSDSDERDRSALDVEIEGLPREVPVPDHVRGRVTRSLEQRGLLDAGPASAGVPRAGYGWPAIAAAATLFLALGMTLGWQLGAPATSGAPAPIESLGPVYALMLREGPDFVLPDGGELREYQEYSSWIAGVRAQGRFIDGLNLEPEGWTVGSTVVSREPSTPGSNEGPVAAIFLVLAPTEEEALALAETLPHVRYGGRVEVRRIVRTDVAPGAGVP